MQRKWSEMNHGYYLWEWQCKFISRKHTQESAPLEYLADGGDVLQCHGVKVLIPALEEKFQGWEQQGLAKQQWAQLLHALKPQVQSGERGGRRHSVSQALLWLGSLSTPFVGVLCVSACMEHRQGHADLAFGTCFLHFTTDSKYLPDLSDIHLILTRHCISWLPRVPLDGEKTAVSSNLSRALASPPAKWR